MKAIEVQFEHNGKKYIANIDLVNGAGGTYHVSVNNYYYGCVHRVPDNPNYHLPSPPNCPMKWVFDSPTGKLKSLEHLFVAAVEKSQAESGISDE